jgi:class 3 adenylate cyclase
MNEQINLPAWLESPDGDRIPMHGSCSLGRSATNQITLPDDKVSRRHALIHGQEQNAYLLVDLGSRNGTYLNGRRVGQPTRLRHADRIRIGQFEFTFHQPVETAVPAAESVIKGATIAEIRSINCWLLMADIIDSTRLIQSMPPDEIPVIIGQWLAECKQTIEECGGGINKFLGDGFLAFWYEREHTEIFIHRALQALLRLQMQSRPRFRVVVHYGQIFLGGASLGEESLSGREVHMVSRMEKLAGSLGEPRLLSEAAWGRLAALVEAKSVGQHALTGFDGNFSFYSF